MRLRTMALNYPLFLAFETLKLTPSPKRWQTRICNVTLFVCFGTAAALVAAGFLVIAAELAEKQVKLQDSPAKSSSYFNSQLCKPCSFSQFPTFPI
jgi:hypothetical protein